MSEIEEILKVVQVVEAVKATRENSKFVTINGKFYSIRKEGDTAIIESLIT